MKLLGQKLQALCSNSWLLAIAFSRARAAFSTSRTRAASRSPRILNSQARPTSCVPMCKSWWGQGGQYSIVGYLGSIW